MTAATLTPALREWIIHETLAGRPPDQLLAELLAAGWTEDQAIDALDVVVREALAQHATQNDLPHPVPVPAWLSMNAESRFDIDGQQVHVLAQMLLPRVVVLGNFLSVAECEELIALAGPQLTRSEVVEEASGSGQVHEARTSQGMAFARGANPCVARIEQRIARLLDWPLENGEALQVLHYAPGAQYKPHYDYFDTKGQDDAWVLARGGQRVATLIMYLNTPESGGATVFPDVGFEVAARQGNAVYFSYDRPHPMTRSLHGGAPVVRGSKWIATKWLREGRHE
jgi:prolyl 4-hydroxylase